MLHYLKTSKTSLLNHSNVAVSLNGNIKKAQDKKRYLRTEFIVLDTQTIVNFFVICCFHIWFNSLEKLYDLQFWSPKKKTEQQKFVTTNCFGVFHVINLRSYFITTTIMSWDIFFDAPRAVNISVISFLNPPTIQKV